MQRLKSTGPKMTLRHPTLDSMCSGGKFTQTKKETLVCKIGMKPVKNSNRETHQVSKSIQLNRLSNRTIYIV